MMSRHPWPGQRSHHHGPQGGCLGPPIDARSDRVPMGSRVGPSGPALRLAPRIEGGDAMLSESYLTHLKIFREGRRICMHWSNRPPVGERWRQTVSGGGRVTLPPNTLPGERVSNTARRTDHTSAIHIGDARSGGAHMLTCWGGKARGGQSPAQHTLLTG